ncbi:MAG TPA: protein kinase [Candidatus Acidoferrales bacterium]|nr:protein kinase [Candidatus Acidoferrales bacterium]
MIEVRKYMQGQVIDGRFPLVKYLGGTEHSDVFLTEYENGRKQPAAIKLVEAPPGNAEAQLIRWRLAARFSHPNLLRIFHMDRCRVDSAAMLYVVMEYAEENLADTLLERPLSPTETRDLLGPILEALEYIHSKGFVHGHIQPSNIMAIGDQLKLSSDGICRLDESVEPRHGQSPYCAPECAAGAVSPACDLWSLGMTLVECLTEHLPKFQPGSREELSLPADLPAPFFDIARHCLIRDPLRRWAVADLKARLRRNHFADEGAAAPFHRVSPPVSPKLAEPQMPVKLARPPLPSRLPRLPKLPDFSKLLNLLSLSKLQNLLNFAKSRNVLSLSALGLAVAAILLGMTFFHRSPNTRGTVSAGSVPPAEQPKITPAKVPRASAPPPPRSANNLPAVNETHASASARPAAPPASAAGDIARGSVVHRALPDVPRSASDTIWGTVRVRVRVNVDPAGNVVGANFDSAGPSRYFARLSLGAAKDWKFRPPSTGGKNASSEWVILFGYTNSATNATAVEQNP